MASELVKRFRNDVAPRLLARFANGGVDAVVTAVAPGATPIDPPTITSSSVSFNCSVSGVSANILTADPNLVASDLQAVCAAIDYTPVVGGKVEINGSTRAIVRVEPIPAAGIPAAYRFFLR